MKGEEKKGKIGRHPLLPFKSQDELVEAIDWFRRYLAVLKSWDAASKWKVKPEDRDLN